MELQRRGRPGAQGASGKRVPRADRRRHRDAPASSRGLTTGAGWEDSQLEQYDVVVVGAGLAGLQATRLLARRGMRVLLADRKRTLADSVHTTGIFVRRTLEDFELPESCLGPPVRSVKLYSPARRALVLESPHDEFRVGRMGRLYEHFLEEALRAGASWSPETRYAGCEEAAAAASGSVVRLERAGRARRVGARFVVGG
ncbi:MAG: FAD-dependent monooxygenase, partial [Acidobacteria bacterium]|nr:FAD-dependent monooxygenase [Acidobacteriota bacterium]